MQSPSFAAPDIALAWLARLRWIAVVGQVAATLAATSFLRVELPLAAIFGVIATTFVTNVFLVWRGRRPGADARLVPAVVLLDVALLTAILALTGGPENPFCTLYVVHVVLSVILLGRFWTWIVVAMSTLCFGTLLLAHAWFETAVDRLPDGAQYAGAWVSLTLLAVLIAYFAGDMHRALMTRDKALSTMRERTERSARFAAVTALAAGAAHELGSPLGTIAVVARELEIAAERAGVGDDIVEDARLIRTEVDRCRAILDRMRLEVGDDLRYEARVVSATEFIDGARADLVADRKARVRTEVDVGAEQFYLSSRAILRAAGVLLRNAFEASPVGGSVAMRIKHDGEHAIVEVEDRGAGMPAEVLRRAGEPFFTTKEMGRGMGMGLFLVKLVIENNDGRLELQSAPGQGTLARLVFPAPRPDAPPMNLTTLAKGA